MIVVDYIYIDTVSVSNVEAFNILNGIASIDNDTCYLLDILVSISLEKPETVSKANGHVVLPHTGIPLFTLVRSAKERDYG